MQPTQMVTPTNQDVARINTDLQAFEGNFKLDKSGFDQLGMWSGRQSRVCGEGFSLQADFC